MYNPDDATRLHYAHRQIAALQDEIERLKAAIRLNPTEAAEAARLAKAAGNYVLYNRIYRQLPTLARGLLGEGEP